jgi:hypothetical protein
MDMNHIDLSHISTVRRMMLRLWDAPDRRTTYPRPAREIAIRAHTESRRARLRG